MMIPTMIQASPSAQKRVAGAPHHAAEAAVNLDLPAQVGLEPLHLGGEVQEEVASLQ